MNINEMSEEEKSVALSVLMGWRWISRLDDSQHVIDADGVILNAGRYMNLYTSENMVLAWRALNWAWLHSPIHEDISSWWYERGTHDYLPAISQDKAQAAWLDKILELAIETGLVQ